MIQNFEYSSDPLGLNEQAHPGYITLGKLFSPLWALVSLSDKWVSIEYLFLRVIAEIELDHAYKVLTTVPDRERTFYKY